MKTTILLLLLFLGGCTAPPDKVALGKQIFIDSTLSEPMGQSCATCHEETLGFVDRHQRAVSEGAVRGLFSARNSMTITYAAFVPPLRWDSVDETYVGGLFWDGRAADLAEQAAEPLLNPLEMANTSREQVVEKIKRADYYNDLVRVYGHSSSPDTIYAWVCDALAAYQSSAEVNPFSAKYDRVVAGVEQFTDREQQGLELFELKGKCAECHVMTPDPMAGKTLFTDHTYDNLGLPKNPTNPHYDVPPHHNPEGRNYVDLGLGAVVQSAAENGKFRVPSLRNIALTAPYGHNGVFAELKEIIHFYNVRDVSDQFAPAEYPLNVNSEELGNLGLTEDEEQLIVEFLHTLTDRQ